MKKTVSIHLGHQLFIIEEDAFDRIQLYLNRVEKSLASEEGIAEILEDIEMRFAELLQEHLGQNRKVVVMNDVSAVISSLGEPEEFAQDSNAHFEKQKSATETKKRLFRDEENDKVGGVAAGIAAYFDLDPVVVRILFVILFFLGFGIALYAILWIVIPAAKTPADRLQMRGENVTIESLKEEFEKGSNKIKNGVKAASGRVKDGANRFASRVNKAVSKGIKIFALLMLIGVFIFTSVFSAIVLGGIDVVPVTGDSAYLSIQDFLSFFFPSGKAYNLIWYGMLIFVYSLVLIFGLSGYSLLTNQKNKWIKITNSFAGIMVGVSVVMIVLGSIQTARDYEVNTEIEFSHITSNAPEMHIKEIPLILENRIVTDNDGVDFIWLNNARVVEKGIHLTFKESKDSLFHVYQRYSAHGIDLTSAQRRSAHIQHSVKFENTNLLIDPYFTFPKGDGLRNQEVELLILVPKDKKLFLGDKIIHVPSSELNGVFYPNNDFETYLDD